MVVATKSAKKVLTPGVLDRPRNVTLGKITPELVDAVVEGGWFEDEATNRLEGFGLGLDGIENAYETFQGAVQGRVTITGIYRRGVPVGFIAWLPRDADGKRVSVHMHLAPEAQGYGVGSAALSRWLGVAFRDGVYRVESEVLHINKPAVRALEHIGFHREGRLTSALWMDDNPYDLILLRLLRKDWKFREA